MADGAPTQVTSSNFEQPIGWRFVIGDRCHDHSARGFEGTCGDNVFINGQLLGGNPQMPPLRVFDVIVSQCCGRLNFDLRIGKKGPFKVRGHLVHVRSLV